LLSYVLNVVVIDCCLTLLYCAFQPVVALINHLLTYLLTYVQCTIYEYAYRSIGIRLSCN